MSSPVGSKKNVKIFVLYLMENINYPLDLVTLNDIVMQTDYVMYLDFAEGFNEMLDDGLIESVGSDEEGSELYGVTARGKVVAGELKSDILDTVLDQSLTAAFRYLDFRRRGVSVSCDIEKVPDGSYTLHCSFTENGKILFSCELSLDSLSRAERMKHNFFDRPENIYRGINALFAGNVNFLFN